MMLLVPTTRLIFFMTSQPPPISCGTSSASPARVVPWQLLIEPLVLQRHLCGPVLEPDPRRPVVVVELLLPDADVDLGEIVTPRLIGGAGVAGDAPVVED